MADDLEKRLTLNVDDKDIRLIAEALEEDMCLAYYKQKHYAGGVDVCREDCPLYELVPYSPYGYRTKEDCASWASDHPLGFLAALGKLDHMVTRGKNRWDRPKSRRKA